MSANEWSGLLLLQAARSKCFMSPDLGVSRLICSRAPNPTAQSDESSSILLRVFYCSHKRDVHVVVMMDVKMKDEVATRETTAAKKPALARNRLSVECLSRR